MAGYISFVQVRIKIVRGEEFQDGSEEEEGKGGERENNVLAGYNILLKSSSSPDGKRGRWTKRWVGHLGTGASESD